MFNLKMIGMMRCSLSTANIDEIGLCAADLEAHFYHLVSHIGPEHFNARRSVLYTEKSVAGQVIILNKSEMTRKRSLVTATLNIRHDQAMSGTSNVGLRNMKVLMMIKT